METSRLIDRLLEAGGWATRAVLGTSFLLLPSASQAIGLGVEIWLVPSRGCGK